MSDHNDEIVGVARDYYNSDDADSFYATIWGGEDLHIGLYQSEQESIFDASRRSDAHMADLLGEVTAEQRILDLGAGYGGSARYLHQRFGSPVACLNLSEVQNQRNRRMNQEQGVAEAIEVVDGNFEEVPYANGSFDIIWSRDSFLHSGRRDKIFDEMVRLLRPGGRVIFTDPMQSDDCPQGVLDPVLARIHLDSMGSPAFYRQVAAERGLEEVRYDAHDAQLPRHYGRVLQEVNANHEALSKVCSEAYIERMQAGLQHWVDAGHNGYLNWGIFLFRKP